MVFVAAIRARRIPEEMGVAFDGYYLLSAFHWAARSRSSIAHGRLIKMSHGIFSSAMDGNVRASRRIVVTPSTTDVRFDAGISTTSLDFFAQSRSAKWRASSREAK
jgi:hypothetical protein